MKMKKGKKRRPEADLMSDAWMEDLRAGVHQLTKRRVLAFVMAQSDPLGLKEPLRMGAKLLLRQGQSSNSSRSSPGARPGCS